MKTTDRGGPAATQQPASTPRQTKANDLAFFPWVPVGLLAVFVMTVAFSSVLEGFAALDLFN